MLDLSKAFDLIPHNLLLDKLKAYGLCTQSLNLIKDYLSSRRQRVKVANAKSDTDKINRGVPQGSVLGPLFFNIFFWTTYSTSLLRLNSRTMPMIIN